MNFAAILDRINQGINVRRSSWKDIKRVRLVQPRVERGMDGPDEIFVLVLNGSRVDDGYETEEEAKKALAGLRRALTNSWKDYRAARDERDALPSKERGAAPASPANPENHLDAVEIKEVPSGRLGRINVPYMVATTQKGKTLPWQPTVDDILAGDWL